METKFTGPANTQKGKTSTTPPASLPVPPQASASLTLQGQLGNRDMGALLRTMGQSASASPMVQRKCSACEEEDQIHRRVDPSAGPAPARGSAPVVPGPGSPIEPGTRTDMESRLGSDLSHVRIHTGASADASARQFGALAYAYGSNIIFRAGQYAPQTGSGRHLLAHELTHVVQQGPATSAPNGPVKVAPPDSAAERQADAVADTVAAPQRVHAPATSLSTVQPGVLRKVAAEPAGASLEDRIRRIDDLLSYGLFDWAITDAEAIEAFQILRAMTNEERATAFQRININRLVDNLPGKFQPELAVLLVSVVDAGVVVQQLFRLLSSFLFDWFVSSSDAIAALRLLEALPAAERDQALDLIGPDRRRRLWGKLPKADLARAEQLWDEKEERFFERQRAAMQPAVATSPEDPIQRKRYEFYQWIKDARGDTNVTARYYDWVDKHVTDTDYLSTTPWDLYQRMGAQVQAQKDSYSEAMRRAKREGEEAVAASNKRLAKWQEFQDFFYSRLEAVKKMNDVEAKVQFEILKRFAKWIADNDKTPAFQKARPIDVYEQLGKGVVTLEVDRERMRAASAPQDQESRGKKLDEFFALAQRLNNYKKKFPYLIPIPSEHRDLLVWGDAMEQVFDQLAQDLRQWGTQHLGDADFTLISPVSVLNALASEHQDVIREAQLSPLIFESIARTDVDWGIAGESFFGTLGKVLAATAIIGLVVGAEILTAGQVTWLLVGVGVAAGGKSFYDRRQEIQETGVDVPVAETVVHSVGDIFGLSQLIEGITGFRLGTQRRLGSVERSQELGEGGASVASVFVGSRAFKTGQRAGALWKSTAPTLGGKVAAGALLPGPAEHFPFGSGSQRLPIPEAPNKLYRIMSLEEAAEALKSGKLPAGAKGKSSSKFVSMDSKYVMLFREKTLADIAQMGEGLTKAEANLSAAEGRLAQLEKAGDTAGAARVRASVEKLRADIAERSFANKAIADPMLKEWFEAPGQKVVVEVELEQGAIDHMLNRAVDERVVNNYNGQDVYIWKLERGYGRNIGIPSWQLDSFNNLVKGIRFYAERGLELFGPKTPPMGNN